MYDILKSKKLYFGLSICILLITLNFMWRFYETDTEKGIKDCVISEEVNSDVINYVKNMDYNIIKPIGKTDSYILTLDILKHKDISKRFIVWGLQEVEARNYIGERIETYALIVSGHKLDQVPKNYKRETIIYVMTCKDEIIGGFSRPNYITVHAGGAYAIDGRTLEEMTGLKYKDWLDMWNELYDVKD